MISAGIAIWAIVGFGLVAFFVPPKPEPPPQSLPRERLKQMYTYPAIRDGEWVGNTDDFNVREPGRFAISNMGAHATLGDKEIANVGVYRSSYKHHSRLIVCKFAGKSVMFIRANDEDNVESFDFYDRRFVPLTITDKDVDEVNEFINKIATYEVNHLANIDWHDGGGAFGVATHWNNDLQRLPPESGTNHAFTWTYEQHRIRYGVPDAIAYRRGIIALGGETLAVMMSSRIALPDERPGPVSWQDLWRDFSFDEGQRYEDRPPGTVDHETIDLKFLVLDETFCNTRPKIRKKLNLPMPKYYGPNGEWSDD